MIRFRCPRCDSEMEVDESFAGRPARCPTCGADLRVPTAEESRLAATPPPGTTRVTVGGRSVDVLPPLETLVIVSMACVGLSVVVFVAAGVLKFVAPPWAVGGLLGALMALLGVIIAVPAYHSVRRSKGRRRGRTHALLSMAVGGGLFLVFVVVAVVGFAREVWLRPTCEENLARIYKALTRYAREHHGDLPPSLETLVQQGYLESADWLTCPAHKAPLGENTYVLTPQVNTEAVGPDGKPWWPRDTMIVCDGRPDAHCDGRVRVLLLDGTIKHVPLKQWPAYRDAEAARWSRTVSEIRALREATGGSGGPPPGGSGGSAPGPPPGSGPPAGSGAPKAPARR